MARRTTRASRILKGGLQFEIPARLAVSVIDQHHAIFVTQTKSLLLNYFDVLPDEARAEHVDDERDDREPRKDVPCRAEIEAAEVAANRRDRGAARQPVIPCPDLFEALIGQHEIDGRGGGLAG